MSKAKKEIYFFKQLNHTVLKSGASDKTVQVYRNDKKPMKPAEVKKLAKHLSDGSDAKFLIRGLAPDMWMTLKGYDDDDVNVLTEDEYFNNKQSKNPGKFQQFFQLQFIIRKSAPKK